MTKLIIEVGCDSNKCSACFYLCAQTRQDAFCALFGQHFRQGLGTRHIRRIPACHAAEEKAK